MIDDTNIVEFIRDLKDNKRYSFAKIATILKKEGYVGRNTHKPIEAVTVRYYYYSGNKASKEKENKVLEATPKNKESLIKEIIALSIPDKKKLELIQALLES
jgi:ribosomal protein S8